jgi:FkbM family methyltransferase
MTRRAVQRIKRVVWAALPESFKKRIKRSYQRLLGQIGQRMHDIINIGSPVEIGSVEIGSFGGFEVAYRRGTTDEAVIAHSFNRDIFFTGVPEYRPLEDHAIIDVGAHIGTFSLLAASKVPRGQVYAIEASRGTYNLLRINVALNRVANIDVSHLALADKPGSSRLHYDTGHWGHTIVTPLTGYGELVSTDSLENFLLAKNISRCNFMKMNCEGAEFPIVLSAAPNVLQRFDMMLILYHCDLYAQRSEQDLVAHLQSSGFHVTIREQTQDRGWIVATNIALDV